MTLYEKIQAGESKTLEFKELLPENKKIAKTAVAFANMAGGRLLIGVQDKSGEIVGISDEEALNLPDKITNIIYDNCRPAILPEIYIESIEGKSVLVVQIFPGSSKPYCLKEEGKQKGTYIRVGATNKPADYAMILELERQRMNLSYDEEIEYEGTTDALFDDAFLSMVSEMTNQPGTKDTLLNLKLIAEENGTYLPTRGGLLLSNPKAHYEYARIKCARFKGTTTSIFIDQKEFDGPLITQIENAMQFAHKHISLGGHLEYLRRIDTYAIPMEAIREALVNAIVHRDYSRSGSDIKFAIFDDCVEITSPGALPGGLEIPDILAGRSEIRNKVLARFFKESHYIEQWGTGINKILTVCEENGLPEPEFIESGLFFQVKIFAKQEEETATPYSGFEVQEDSKPYGETARTSFGEYFGIQQSKDLGVEIIEIISEHPQATVKQMAEYLKVSPRTLDRRIEQLKQQGTLKRIGSRRGGHWEVSS